MTGEEYRDFRRRELGLTQAEAARLLGVDRLTVLRREGGKTPVTREAELALRALMREDRGSTA